MKRRCPVLVVQHVGEDMVESASQLAVGDVGIAAICPVLEMMHVAPARVAITTGPGAVSVSGDDGPSLGRGPYPGSPADVNDLPFRAEDDPAQGAVAGESAKLLDGEDMAVLGLVKPPSDALEGRQITDQVDVWLLSAHSGRVAVFEIMAGQVLEGIMTTLTRGSGVVRGGGGMKASMAARKARPAVVVIHPSTRNIPPRLSGGGDAPHLHLLELVPDRAWSVHRLSPVLEGASCIGDSQILDDVHQPFFTLSELIRQIDRLFEEDGGLVGGQSSRCPGPEGGTRRPEYTGTSNETMGPTRCHSTAVFEEGGERWIAEMVRPGPIFERGDPSETLGLEQTTHRLQLDQIVGQLVEMEMLDVLDNPFLECRSEGAHSICPNIRSTLHGGR